MSSIYIHIPFCDTLCNYCDFCKVLNYKKFTKQYLEMLAVEIATYYDNREVKTLYIGGGTPSALSLAEIKYLANILKPIKLSKDYEFTFECNFENIDQEKLQLLKAIGVNRLSFGVQTFNQRLLQIINRKHTYVQVQEMLGFAKAIGFNNINVDLIFNLPTQTMDELEKDLELFISLDVSHISLYSLILEQKSVFGANGVTVCEDLGADMYTAIIEKLPKFGYNHYEISNFCKTSYESKHNLAYWNYHDYFGFGLGAHSLLANTRYENPTSITAYLKHIEKTVVPLSKSDVIAEYIMMNLRKMQGINLADFETRFLEELPKLFDIEKLLNDLLVIEDGYLKLTSKGILFANDVFIEFLGD